MTRHAKTAIVALLVLAGCGGAQMGQTRVEQAPSAAESAAGQEEGPSDPRDEILRLERQIQARSGAVPPDGADGAGGTADAGVPGVTRQPGAQPVNQCEQACQASGSICQAAARICSLAEEMDDEWARGRCRLASRTCADVRRRSTNACGTC